MNASEGRKNKKKAEAEAKKVVSWAWWQEKKELADKEEEVLRKEIEDLKAWVDMIETMNDEQRKGYLESQHDELKRTKVQKTNKNKVKCSGMSKSSSSTGIMASVWKFHKE